MESIKPHHEIYLLVTKADRPFPVRIVYLYTNIQWYTIEFKFLQTYNSDPLMYNKEI